MHMLAAASLLSELGSGFCRFAVAMLIQSSILIAVLYLTDMLIRRHVRAIVRYCIWMLVLIKLMLPPALCLPTGIGYWCNPAYDVFSESSRMPPARAADVIYAQFSLHHPPPVSGMVIADDKAHAPSAASDALAPSHAAVIGRPAYFTWPAVLFLVWLAGALLLFTLLWRRFMFAKRLIKQSDQAHGRWHEMLRQCQHSVGVRGNIELRLSNDILSPAACGLLKPVILIPHSLLDMLSGEKLHAVLLHELAHIKRGDLWVNFMQTILQIVYFYNPLLWLANTYIRDLREKAVDEMVLTKIGGEVKRYSDTLIDVAEIAFSGTRFGSRLVGVVESKKALTGRIKYMLSRPFPKTAKLGGAGLITVAAAAAILLPMGQAGQSGVNREAEAATLMSPDKGLHIHGQVFDPAGDPIAGASVAQGSNRWQSRYFQVVRTDGDGRFIFDISRPGGHLILTAQAPGYAPELKEIQAIQNMPAVEFRLPPGNLIQGKIVDTNDMPIAGASISAGLWRGHRTVNWEAKTDARGHFEWKDAPADEMFLNIGKSGYMSVIQHGISPAHPDCAIKMRRALYIRGNVFDAETGAPIPRFEVTRGNESGRKAGNAIFWDWHRSRLFDRGEYRISFSDYHPSYYVRVEADGYLPEISRPLKYLEEDIVLNISLKKGSGPSGVVQSSDGAPVSGAEVIIGTASRPAWLNNGRNDPERSRNRFVKTMADGRFVFPVQTEPYFIFVAHASGFAQVSSEDFKPSSAVTLKPWARVEGVFKKGNQPAGNQIISASPEISLQYRCIVYVFRDVTDENGRYAFDRMLPGRVSISRYVANTNAPDLHSHQAEVKLSPDEAVKVDFGGAGRTVMGKLTWPEDSEESVDWSYTQIHIYSKPPTIPWLQYAPRTFWVKAWPIENSCQAHAPEIPRIYTIQPDNDGGFRVEDIPAGEYLLRVRVLAPAVDAEMEGAEIGSLDQEFGVPEISGIPVNLGVLDVSACRRLKNRAL